MIFAQMLEIVALTDLALVLCARKFSFIIIFKALKLAAAVFMYFFKDLVKSCRIWSIKFSYNLFQAESLQHSWLV